jgi:two-component system, sensor histidine kinase ChiS
MKGKLLIFINLLFLLSCIRDNGDKTHVLTSTPREVEAVEFVISPDKISPPLAIPLKGSKVINALPPVVTPTNVNVRAGIVPKKIKSGTPIVKIPGKDGVLYPDTFAVEKRYHKANIPDLIRAKDPYFPGINPHSFTFLTRLQGVQHDDISSITQDAIGNIWMGTYGGGVIRFDGLSFAHFTEEEGLSHNYILSILATTDGNIWFGTRAEGAVRFDGTNFFNLTVLNGLPDNRVEKIFEDSKGNIWFGTYDGAAKFDGRKLIVYKVQNGLPGEIIYSIAEDKIGNIWFGSRGGGISRFDGHSFSTFNTDQGLNHNFIVESMVDKMGNVWFCSDGGGICSFDGEFFYHYTKNEGLSDNYTNTILEDNSGNIWVGTRTSGLDRMKNGQLANFDDEQGLINNFVTSIMQDRNGNIWFGTYGGGLAQYRGLLFTHYSEKQGLSDGFVRSITQDSDGNLWFGTNIAGVFRYDGKNFYNYNTDHGLAYHRVGSILQSRNGIIWFATTGGGVSGFDGKVFTNYTTENGLSDDFIISMMEDREGNLWFVNRNTGVTKFDGNTFIHYGEEQGLSDNNARCIIQDHEGNIWVGTRAGGVTRIEKDRIVHINEEGGLLYNNILDMKQSSDGTIWIATNGRGVARYDGTKFTYLTEREGLASNFVYSVLEDNNGTIWFGTRMGLSKLLGDGGFGYMKTVAYEDSSFVSGRINLFFKNYTVDDGYLGIGSNSRTIFEDNTGHIWIGANDLLTSLNLDGDIPDTIAPGIQLTGVGLFNEHVHWQELFNNKDSGFMLENGLLVKNFHFEDISPWYGLPVGLSLPYNSNYISFSFVGVASNFTSKVRYVYQLEGLEKTWSTVSSRPETNYANLKWGKYTFRVRAVNSEGYWSDEFSFPFTIRPPWWRTWWANTIYLILVFVIIYVIYSVRYRIADEREQKRQKELILQQEVAIARKSAEFKQNFLANMSHEIRTPLTGILGMVSLLNKLPLEETAKEYVEALKESGDTLRETINMILDISKIEAGKIELKESLFKLSDVFDQSIRLFETICSTDVELKTWIDPELPVYILSDHQRVNQIIKNFLSNAVKFTREGTITMNAWKGYNENKKDISDEIIVRIDLIDTGIGISFENQKKLFTPFYQAGESIERNVEGTGLGLAICKELATLMGGSVGVESEPGKGSKFWFTFKAKKGQQQTNLIPDSQVSAKPVNQSLHILLVEDKVVTQKVVSLMLSAMGNIVTIAKNGKEAIEKYTPNTFDLILMDIQMPEVDGITATKILREKFNVLPPIVGLSANAFEGDREKYMSMGLDEYITKPVKESDFRRILTRFGLLNQIE